MKNLINLLLLIMISAMPLTACSAGNDRMTVTPVQKIITPMGISPRVSPNAAIEGSTLTAEPTPRITATPEHALAISKLKNRTYPPSPLVIEETLSPGANYTRTVASYTSDGLKIFGLLTVPTTAKPDNGFPVILFLHGYINPRDYVTTKDYVSSQDGLARSGFITFKPDLRGHGKSEGQASGAHFSQDYVIDTLNALASLQTFVDADPTRIGVWGHSNGGEIGLRAMVVSKEIKAGVFWAGVVGSYQDMLETYNQDIPFMKRGAPELTGPFGKPSENPAFWNTIDPYAYLKDISGPVQLHQGTGDEQVPPALSEHLAAELQRLGKNVELFTYPDADHNLSGPAFAEAMQRTVAFFQKYL